MSNITCSILPAALLAVLEFASPTLAQSPSIEIESAIQINRANELVREGKFAEAIEGYRDAQDVESHRDQLAHNLAVAQFRHGDLDAAKILFAQTAASSDASLASSSRFNLGNCFYTDAVKCADHDKPAAIESLRQAISHYRGSLAGNPHHVDARANIELAAELIRKLKQEQQQEQQDQQQDQQQKPASDSSHESESNSQDAKDGDSKPKQDAAKDDRSSEEPSETQSAEQQAEQSPEQPTPAQQSSDDRSPNSASQHQDQPSSAADQQQTDEPTSEEDGDDAQRAVPAGELTPAGEQESDAHPDDRVTVDDPNTKEQPMTTQEALKMLQAVRDRDMLRRLQHERAERSRHITVDRDW